MSASLKWVSLATLLVQNAFTPIFFRFAMTESASDDRFDTVIAVLVQELLKFGMSMLLLLAEERFSPHSLLGALRDQVVRKPGDTIRLAIPAVLYFVQNIFLQYAGANLPAAVFQVTYQGKTLVVAMCSILLLQKELSRAKWLAIAVMGGGLCVVQLSKSTESAQDSMANAAEQNITMGLVYVLFGCLCSGFAGVYFEKMMKRPTTADGPKPSMWVRNIQLAAFSAVIGVANIMATSVVSDEPAHEGGLLHGFTPKVWMMVINNAVGGLCVAFVIKYADNILKGFACALATIVSSILAVPLFGFMISASFIFGMATVLVATFLYGGTLKLPGEWWNAEPGLCASVRHCSSTTSKSGGVGYARVHTEDPGLEESQTGASAENTKA